MSAKVIAAAKFRNNFADTLNSVKKDNFIIITRRGKSERVLVDIDKFEDLLAASAPEYLAEIQKSRKEAQKGELYSIDEVFGSL